MKRMKDRIANLRSILAPNTKWNDSQQTLI